MTAHWAPESGKTSTRLSSSLIERQCRVASYMNKSYQIGHRESMHLHELHASPNTEQRNLMYGYHPFTATPRPVCLAGSSTTHWPAGGMLPGSLRYREILLNTP